MAPLRRRDFIKTAVWGTAAAFGKPESDGLPSGLEDKATSPFPFSLGLASYTFREFNLDQTVAMAKRLALEKIVLKSMHLPLETPAAEVSAAAAKVRGAGLDLYGCGVVYMTSESEVEQAFGYARAAGMRMIIGAPNVELLSSVEKKVRETGIKLAIHNHGPEDKLYPTPAAVYEKIQNLDKGLGLCIDVGHTVRAGTEPAEAAAKFAERLLDVHIKDVTAATPEGQTVEMGRGVIDIPKLIRTLIRLDYRGALAFEFEKDGQDPLPGVAESVGYLRGILAVI